MISLPTSIFLHPSRLMSFPTYTHTHTHTHHVTHAQTNKQHHLLQEDLSNIYDWVKNRMEFNDSKFHLLRCGVNKTIHENTILLFSDKQVISTSTYAKCLGIHVSEDDTFQHHITEPIKKARRIAGWTLRTFYSREEERLLSADTVEGIGPAYPGLHIVASFGLPTKLWTFKPWNLYNDPTQDK